MTQRLKIPLAALAKQSSAKTATAVNLKKIPIYGLETEREHKEEKIYVTVSHTEKSIAIKLHDMSITIRTNGTKYERHTHNITVASDLQYANVIMGHITAQMKNLSNDMTAFITAIQALNITQKELHKDSEIAVSAIQKWLDTNYSYVGTLYFDVVNMTELFNMCEGYAKIAHDLSVKCGTASSIRIICNRLVPPAKKDNTKEN